MSSPFPTDLTAASTGERIAWTSAFRGVRNVWVADGPSFAAKQVTRYTEDDGMQIASVRLTPDGKTVLYARGSEQNHEGEVADPTSNINQPHQQVFAADVDQAGQPRLLGEMGCTSEECEDIEISPDGQLAAWAARKQIWIATIAGGTQAKPIGYIRGDNRQPKWSPDGKQIAFESDRGDHSFIGIYDRSRDTIRWIAPTFDRDAMPRWSADGASIAYVHVAGREMKQPLIPIEPEPWSLRIANANTGEAREIWHSSSDINASLPRTEEESFYFARDRLVFGYEQDGWNHLYSVLIQGGQATLLTPGEFDVEEVSLTPDRQTVIYTSNQNDVDRRHIWSVPAAGGTPKALSSGETIEWTPVVTGDGKIVTCLGSSATTPAMPYHLNGTRREMIASDTLPKDFPSAQLVVPKQVIFTAEDGWKIHGQLFVPKNVKGRAPGLLFMHGGSKRQMMLGFHNMYYYHNAYAENQYLASRGFVVLSVNYRTGIMYGRTFREPEDGGWRGASEYKDIYVEANPKKDKLLTVR